MNENTNPIIKGITVNKMKMMVETNNQLTFIMSASKCSFLFALFCCAFLLIAVASMQSPLFYKIDDGIHFFLAS